MIPTIFIPGRREALRNYTAAIYSAGGMPICSTDSADSVLCGGLRLPGGGDIGKTLINQGFSAEKTARANAHFESVPL